MKNIFIFVLVFNIVLLSPAMGMIVPSTSSEEVDINEPVAGSGPMHKAVGAWIIPLLLIGPYMLADDEEGNDYWGYVLTVPSIVVLVYSLNV